MQRTTGMPRAWDAAHGGQGRRLRRGQESQAWLVKTGTQLQQVPRSHAGTHRATRETEAGTRLWARLCHPPWLWVHVATSPSPDFLQCTETHPCFVTRPVRTSSGTQKPRVCGSAAHSVVSPACPTGAQVPTRDPLKGQGTGRLPPAGPAARPHLPSRHSPTPEERET